MAKQNEGQSLRDNGNRKKKWKRRKRILIFILLIIIILMGAVFYYTIYNRKYDSYGVIKTTEIAGENVTGYLSYGTSMIKYSRDGVSVINQDGNTKWNASYEMADPIVDTCKKYIAIADKGGKEIYIYNDKGKVGDITTPYQIQKIEVASQGVVAALMEQEKKHYIIMYDTDGTELMVKKTNVNSEGYPLDLSLSEDGEKLVTSYLSYHEGALVSKISFFNFGEVGQNYTDRFVGGFTYEGIVIPRVSFVNNDTVCVYKDNGFSIFAMQEKPSEIYNEKFEHRIQSILYSSKYTGVVLKEDGKSYRKLMLYNLKGNKILDKKLEFVYDTISLSGEEVIMYDDTDCRIMKINGSMKFEASFDTTINALVPINGLDRYFLTSGNRLMDIQLKE